MALSMPAVQQLAASYDDIYDTFVASIKSVGTAVTLAAVGVYLHRKGFIPSEGKRTLALISQQVTFPLFLFTKIIYCNQDWSDDPCPDIGKSLNDVWMLLWWPIYVVGMGVVVGYLVAYVCQTPKAHVKAVLAACAFGNSTGLPITLLIVVHENFPSTSDLGRIDPTLFLSVYLLLYPILQWGFGGWLLAPEESEDKTNAIQQAEETVGLTVSSNASDQQQQQQQQANNNTDGNERPTSHKSMRNVLNNVEVSNYYLQHRRGLSSNDEGMYMSEVNLAGMAGVEQDEDLMYGSTNNSDNLNNGLLDSVGEESESECTPMVPELNGSNGYGATNVSSRSVSEKQNEHVQTLLKTESSDASCWNTVGNIAVRCLQPPVLGALAGIFCALFPALHGLLVDIVDRSGKAPLQWMFDGLHSVGLAAVPINMMILGCNLSAAKWNFKEQPHAMPYNTMVGVVIGKMLILPIIGIYSTLLLRKYVWSIPDEIDGAFYLVAMIVFLCPTANNVMVMVELSGSSAKEDMARVIALQYAVSPLFLSITMTIAIGYASNWS